MAEPAAPASTRESIIDAAEELFASQGYHATTIAQLAERVGIKGPGIYKHFASKRALFEEVLERVFSPFLTLVATDSGSGWNQAGIVRQHLANPNASRILQHATLSGGEDLALLVERWYVPFFRGVRGLSAAPDSPFSPVSVMAFHGMLLGYLTLAPLHEAIFGIDPLEEDALAELAQLQAQFADSLAVSDR